MSRTPQNDTPETAPAQADSAADAPVHAAQNQAQAAAEAFQRRPVTWGRPPQATFRAGPLPKGISPLGPLMAPQPLQAPRPNPLRPSGGVLSGSLVPMTTPQPTGQLTAPVTAPPVLTPAPNVTPVAPEPRLARPTASATPPSAAFQAPQPAAQPAPQSAPQPAPRPTPEPDLTVRPLPAAPLEPLPEPRPVVAAAPASRPVQTEPAFVPATRKAKGASRLPLYAGAAIGVLALAIGGGVWLMRQNDQPPAPAAAVETAPVAPTVAEGPTSLVEMLPVEAAPAPVVETPAETPANAAPRPATSAPARRPTASAPANARPNTGTATAPVQRPPQRAANAPSVTAPAPSATRPAQTTPAPANTPPPPVISTEPLVPDQSAPTAARRQNDDPDAPIVTRPQPLED